MSTKKGAKPILRIPFLFQNSHAVLFERPSFQKLTSKSASGGQLKKVIELSLT
jgi:hypothetical protein